MKVKNVGGKIVSIGTTAILPGETAEVSDSYAENPAITCLVKHKHVAIVKDASGDGDKKAKADAKKKAAEAKAKAEAEKKAAEAKAKAEAEKAANGGEA